MDSYVTKHFLTHCLSHHECSSLQIVPSGPSTNLHRLLRSKLGKQRATMIGHCDMFHGFIQHIPQLKVGASVWATIHWAPRKAAIHLMIKMACWDMRKQVGNDIPEHKLVLSSLLKTLLARASRYLFCLSRLVSHNCSTSNPTLLGSYRVLHFF